MAIYDIDRNLCTNMGTCAVSDSLNIRIAAQRWAEDRCEGCGRQLALMAANEDEAKNGRILEQYLNNPNGEREVTFAGRVAWADWEGHGLFAERSDLAEDMTDWVCWFLFTDTTNNRHWYAATIKHDEVVDVDSLTDDEFCEWIAGRTS